MRDAIFTFLFIVISLSFAAIMQLPLFIGFAIGLTFVIILIYRKGYSTKDILLGSIDGMKRIKPVLMILALISLLIPAWIVSGTVPTMITYIISWIEPNWIIFFAFVISALTSFILGTAIGTLGSLGIIIIGVAVTVNVPIPLVAGALVSGAFVGDRCSPLSSIFHLAANSVDVNPKKLFKQMLPSTIVMTIVSLLFYFFIGLAIEPNHSIKSITDTTLLKDNFQISLITLVPIVILFGSILLNVSTVLSLTLAVSAAVVIALVVQQESLVNILQSLALGYSQPPEGLENILRGGGILKMWQLFIFVLLASIMNGLLNRTEIFKKFMTKMFEKASSLTNYTVRTVVIGIVFAIVGGNQAFPVMLTGSSLKGTWVARGYKKEELGRVVCDSALVTSGLVPWNMVAILSAAAINVPTTAYAPYAVFLWIGPVITIFVSHFYSSKQKSKPNQQKVIAN